MAGRQIEIENRNKGDDESAPADVCGGCFVCLSHLRCEPVVLTGFALKVNHSDSTGTFSIRGG